jgi:hypothetical protein
VCFSTHAAHGHQVPMWCRYFYCFAVVHISALR